MSAPYDFVIAGGGAAGLSLAWHLAHSPLGERARVLVVDRDTKEHNDRTFCFWTTTPTPYAPVVHRSWRRVRFVAERFARELELGDYQYQMIRGVDFYRFVREQLASRPNFEFVLGEIERVEDGDAGAAVVVDGARRYEAGYVFDSLFKWTEFDADPPGRYHHLQQHFRGWEVETAHDAFETDAATMFDFRTPQRGDMRFFYVLPLSPRRALVEHVLMSGAGRDGPIKTYVEQVLGLREYRVVGGERGVSPLTDRPFPRRHGRRVMATGVHGGRLKPSSGYAFMRIQEDSAAIVRSLLAHGHPFDVPPDSRVFRFFDRVMLEVMARHGGHLAEVFACMFRYNPAARIFRFLDERAGAWDTLALVATLPPWAFVAAAARLALERVRRGPRRLHSGDASRNG